MRKFVSKARDRALALKVEVIAVAQKQTAGCRRRCEVKTRELLVDRFGLGQAGDLVLEMKFPPLEFGELEVVGTDMGHRFRDFLFQRPVLSFEVG
jgi:hypothetical protein